MGIENALEVFFILAAVVGGPLLAVMVVPALARRIVAGGRAEPRADRDDQAQELERLARRVAELEERVDFAERLLAQQREGVLPRTRME